MLTPQFIYVFTYLFITDAGTSLWLNNTFVISFSTPAAGLSYQAMPTRIWTIFVSLKPRDLTLLETVDRFSKNLDPD